jgi:phospholipid-translocating ATPase
MIQEAHIGIGITGKEGAQAAMASDFVITQFRFLSKLVLCHGLWSYYRVSEMSMNFMFKAFYWTASLFIFQAYQRFPSVVLYNFYFILLFNLVFTSLPPLLIGSHSAN